MKVHCEVTILFFLNNKDKTVKKAKKSKQNKTKQKIKQKQNTVLLIVCNTTKFKFD